VEGQDVEEGDERGDWRAFGGANIHRGWGPLKHQGANSFPQEGRDPQDQVSGDTALP